MSGILSGRRHVGRGGGSSCPDVSARRVAGGCGDVQAGSVWAILTGRRHVGRRAQGLCLVAPTGSEFERQCSLPGPGEIAAPTVLREDAGSLAMISDRSPAMTAVTVPIQRCGTTPAHPARGRGASSATCEYETARHNQARVLSPVAADSRAANPRHDGSALSRDSPEFHTCRGFRGCWRGRCTRFIPRRNRPASSPPRRAARRISQRSPPTKVEPRDSPAPPLVASLGRVPLKATVEFAARAWYPIAAIFSRRLRDDGSRVVPPWRSQICLSCSSSSQHDRDRGAVRIAAIARVAGSRSAGHHESMRMGRVAQLAFGSRPRRCRCMTS